MIDSALKSWQQTDKKIHASFEELTVTSNQKIIVSQRGPGAKVRFYSSGLAVLIFFTQNLFSLNETIDEELQLRERIINCDICGIVVPVHEWLSGGINLPFLKRQSETVSDKGILLCLSSQSADTSLAICILTV